MFVVSIIVYFMDLLFYDIICLKWFYVFIPFFYLWYDFIIFYDFFFLFFFSSRRRHTRCALVTGVQMCALPIYGAYLPNRYEYLYRKSPLSAIWKAVTPLTMKTEQGLYLSVHEAALVDYAEMTLENVGHNRLKADLIPWSDGRKVKTDGAFVSPWRTQIGRASCRESASLYV